MSRGSLAGAIELGVGLAAVLAVGWAATRPPRRPRSWLLAAARAGTVGTALLTVTAYGWVRLGGSLSAGSALGLAALVALTLYLLRRPSHDEPAVPASAPRWLVALPALIALTVFTWKLCVVPLWSWDHYAIWGVKARKAMPQGVLETDWLQEEAAPARPDYPLGLPIAWRVLTLGAEPGELDVRAVHGLTAWALVVLVAGAAFRASGSRVAAGAAAGLTAASPLLWDTESVGLADLPLALFAVAAALPLAEPAGRPPGGPAPVPNARALLVAGACAGFLPWIKSEGLPLALLLAGVTALGLARGGSVRRSLAAYLAPALALGAAGLSATPGLADREAGFFRGDWLARGGERLSAVPALLGRAAGELLEPGWLAIWPLFAAALVVAAVAASRGRGGRSWAGLGLGLVVAAQLTLYIGTYLVSYIPWETHLETSFYRVAAALVPLALVSAAAAAGAVSPGGAIASGGGSSEPGRRR